MKTSISLDSKILAEIEKHLIDFKNRSQFIEAASSFFIAHLERRQCELRDLEIINNQAEKLNKEAEDVLSYQVQI